MDLDLAVSPAGHYWILVSSASAFVHAQLLSCVGLVVTPRTIAHQRTITPLSLGFFGQEYWSGLPFPAPSPVDLPDRGIKSVSPVFPALAGGFFITEPTMSLSQLYHASSRDWVNFIPRNLLEIK